METRQIKFAIQNDMCKYYADPCGCEEDPSNFHTCCKEECPNVSTMFGIKEEHIKLTPRRQLNEKGNGKRCS